MLPSTNMTELAAPTTPVFQLVLQRALVLLQTKLVEGLTTDLAIHKLGVRREHRGAQIARRNINQILPAYFEL